MSYSNFTIYTEIVFIKQKQVVIILMNIIRGMKLNKQTPEIEYEKVGYINF